MMQFDVMRGITRLIGNLFRRKPKFKTGDRVIISSRLYPFSTDEPGIVVGNAGFSRPDLYGRFICDQYVYTVQYNRSDVSASSLHDSWSFHVFEADMTLVPELTVPDNKHPYR